jgi:hypothetical protein
MCDKPYRRQGRYVADRSGIRRWTSAKTLVSAGFGGGAILFASIAMAGCALGVSTGPPRAYRGAFVMTIDTAITSECALVPGVFGGERHGTCLYLEPKCHDCGHHVVKGATVTVVAIHHGADMETARVKIGAGAETVLVDRANWDDLKKVIAPASPSDAVPRR